MRSRLVLFRWVARVVRVERRQHALVVGMLALGIALAVVVVSMAVHLNQPQRTIDGFESELFVRSVSEDNATVQTFNAEAQRLMDRHGDLSFVVTSREAENRLVQILGANPAGSALEQRYHLIDGAWPASGEVAVTRRATDRLVADSALEASPIGLGDSVNLAGEDRFVSGIFEDRWAINDAAAIVPPADIAPFSTVRFSIPDGGHPIVGEALDDWGIDTDADGDSEQPIQAFIFDTAQTGDSDTSAVAGGYLVGAVLALQIAVLGSAGFTVLAQRRTQQLGMLSAIGAKPKQLAGVLRATGLIVGITGGAIGLIAGVVIVIAAVPLIQLAVPYRLERFDLPWVALLPMLPLAVVTALLASWWPARRIRKLSTIDALNARRPSNARTAPAAVVGLIVATAGMWLTIVGAPRNSPPMVVGGVVAITIGALLVVPAAIQLLDATARWARLPVRVGWRDLNRNRSRSAAAAAAAAMAIAVPFGISTFIASLDETWRPELPSDTVVFSGAFMWDPESQDRDLTAMQVTEAAGPFRDVVPNLTVLTFDVPVDAEGAERAGHDGTFPFAVTTIRQSGTQRAYTAFASEELLAAMELEAPGEGVDVITTLTTPLDLPEDITIERQTARYKGFPDVLLITEIEGTSRNVVIPGGWYLQKPTDFDQAELDRMEAIAERSPEGLFVSGFEQKPPFLLMRIGALAVAGLLGLAVVAVAVALIRTEAEPQIRSLNAIGASPRVSRSIGAATAAGLTWVAVAVAVPATFALLAGVYLNSDEEFDFTMPWLELAIIGLAIPAIAAAGGWLLTTNQVTRKSI